MTNVHEVIIRYPIEGKLSNLNVLITKLGYATSTNLLIFDGEKDQSTVNKTNMLKKAPLPTSLEKEVSEMSTMPNKIIKTLPVNKVLCKVTNAVSPNEIWVQDIVDSNNCYDQLV